MSLGYSQKPVGARPTGKGFISGMTFSTSPFEYLIGGLNIMPQVLGNLPVGTAMKRHYQSYESSKYKLC